MNPNPNQLAAFRMLEQAQKAMKSGDKRPARKYAEQAARLAPELEDVWLMMAALASPRASVAFLERALQINPESERARKGMLWAVERVRKEAPHKPVAVPAVSRSAAPVARPQPAHVKKAVIQPRFSYAAILVTLLCIVAMWAVWQGVTPAQAFLNSNFFSSGQHEPAWAQVDIAKPAYTPISPPTATMLPAFTLPFMPSPTLTSAPVEDIPSPTATFIPILTPTDTPPPTATDIATSTALETNSAELTPLPTDSSEPTPTPLPTDSAVPGPTQYVPPPPSGNPGGGTHWIDVDLTNQMVYAYEGNTIVNSFIVSTGTWQYPTVTGQYPIYVKYRYKDMSGPGYFLPNVPYTMFFYKGYAVHGTYWHSNFGTPMSHGCINLTIPDSEWLYNFSSVGTLVNIHY